MYLLDTCVFSEFAKPHPDPQCAKWASSVHEADVFLSVLVLGELLRGLERIKVGGRRDALRAWIESLFSTHRARLVPIDHDVVLCWAKICTEAESLGRPPAAIDSLIAASAFSRGLVLVTRNTDDFRHLGVNLFNPWT
jgi:predicted nucleic acid-binding protein